MSYARSGPFAAGVVHRIGIVKGVFQMLQCLHTQISTTTWLLCQGMITMDERPAKAYRAINFTRWVTLWISSNMIMIDFRVAQIVYCSLNNLQGLEEKLILKEITIFKLWNVGNLSSNKEKEWFNIDLEISKLLKELWTTTSTTCWRFCVKIKWFQVI